MLNYGGRSYNCAMELVLDRVGGKWKGLVLWHLGERPYRFNALRREFQGISQKMLTQQLRELEQDGLILRKVFSTMPPHVEYSLSESGKTFLPLLHAMNGWGQQNLLRRTTSAEAVL